MTSSSICQEQLHGLADHPGEVRPVLPPPVHAAAGDPGAGRGRRGGGRGRRPGGKGAVTNKLKNICSIELFITVI